jgi:hypothetical protein
MPITITGTDGHQYQVNSLVYSMLSGVVPAPAAMAEEAMIDSFLDTMDARFQMTPGHNGNLQEHYESCAGVLMNDPAPARRREMVGELLAAMVMAAGGWRMAWGYSGNGHTGLDQVWYRTAAMGGAITEIAVVEAKGGNGVLSTTPRYFEGTTHRGQLGMNDPNATTQMTPAWVFVNANGFIGRAFTASVINNIALPAVLTPMEATFGGCGNLALMICCILWRPLPEVSGGYTGTRVAADTRHNTALVHAMVHGALRCTTPDLRGFIITNGELPFWDQRRYSDWD